MSSGYGLKTKYGKCYGEYMDARKCAVHAADFKECKPISEDFFECLHNLKEKEWLRKVDLKISEKKEEYLKTHPKENSWRSKLPF
eukprot:gene2793-4201_t